MDKLDRALEAAGADVPRFLVDMRDAPAVSAVASRARVALSFVGPYRTYGDALVDACADHGVDYVDITGETPWVRAVIDRVHGRAMASGARLVPFCGFDSVPSDLGAWMVVSWIRDQWNVGTNEVFAGFSARGGLSGGTAASALAGAEAKDGRSWADPVLLNPDELRTNAMRSSNPDFTRVAWSERHERWLTPFFMAPFNTRVVRRSAALAELAGAPYGQDFRYQEVMETRSRFGAYAMAGVLWAGAKVMYNPWSRRLATRFLPSPGQGPSDEEIRNGFYRVRLFARTEDGRDVLGVFSHDQDPGYGSTITMACEGALTLAGTARADLPGGPDRAGVLTPAFALGGPYLGRLRAAGITAEVQQNAAPNGR